ncbi:MAG: hypothetical protein ACYDA3_14195 [Gaiellaceae bacterium]
MAGALFGDQSLMFSVFRDSLFAVAFIGWFGAAAYARIDARRRFANRTAITLWTVFSLLLPVAGTFVYVLVRPAQTPFERRARRYRLLYLETLVASRDHVSGTTARMATTSVEQAPPELVSVPLEVAAV